MQTFVRGDLLNVLFKSYIWFPIAVNDAALSTAAASGSITVAGFYVPRAPWQYVHMIANWLIEGPNNKEL